MTVNLTRFAIWYVGIIAALAIISGGFNYFLDVDISNAGLSFIPAMLAAMVEGQKHAMATRDPISKPWKQAAVLSLVAIGVSVLLSVPFAFITPDALSVVQQYFVFFLVGIAVFFVIFWLIIRFFLGFGAKMQWKSIDQKSGKI